MPTPSASGYQSVDLNVNVFTVLSAFNVAPVMVICSVLKFDLTRTFLLV
jgi:hypothetical protein